MNKKASIMTSVYALPALMLIFLLLFLYMVLIVIPTYQFSPTKTSLVAQDSVNYDLLLLNFLKTPIEYKGEQMIMSDLFRSFDAKPIIIQQSNKIFDYVLENKSYNLKLLYYLGNQGPNESPYSEEYYLRKITKIDPDKILVSNVTLPNFKEYSPLNYQISNSYYKVVLEVEK